jgi:hypothetical protein
MTRKVKILVTNYQPLDCYLQEYTKIPVYEMKLQMVRQLTGHISDAAAQIRNVTMTCRETSPLSQTAKTFLR